MREQLLGEEAKDGNYVAVHLRMGHLAGEMYDVNRWASMRISMCLTQCRTRTETHIHTCQHLHVLSVGAYLLKRSWLGAAHAVAWPCLYACNPQQDGALK